MLQKSYDIVVVGGGAVGSSAALALSLANFSVLLIDDQLPEKRCQKENDNRVFALAPGTKSILAKLNVWQYAKKDATSIQHIHASNKGSFGAVRMHADDYDLDALGYMLAAAVIRTVQVARPERRQARQGRQGRQRRQRPQRRTSPVPKH